MNGVELVALTSHETNKIMFYICVLTADSRLSPSFPLHLSFFLSLSLHTERRKSLSQNKKVRSKKMQGRVMMTTMMRTVTK